MKLRKIKNLPFTYEKKNNPHKAGEFIFYLFDIKTNKLLGTFSSYELMINYIEVAL